ncbi:MAG: thioredoxin family protein [Bdellovibrionales bacterium]|nr:thioredoxin family protein [Bdellovibrionales bacterium]
MALMHSDLKELGTEAPDFDLPGTDGRNHRLADFKDKKVLVVIFMCNHCPYVKAVETRIAQLARDYAPKGVQLVGINPNDPVSYPDDSMEAMKARGLERGYTFPYLRDDDQEVARAYGAVCTPDPYVYENVGGKFLLRYHGRIDDSWKDESQVKARELAAALDAILAARPLADRQFPAMGCSIKWKNL